MDRVHLLTSDPSGHDGKSLPELTDDAQSVILFISMFYITLAVSNETFLPRMMMMEQLVLYLLR